jgi:hypothetical protein
MLIYICIELSQSLIALHMRWQTCNGYSIRWHLPAKFSVQVPSATKLTSVHNPAFLYLHTKYLENAVLVAHIGLTIDLLGDLYLCALR